MDDVPQPAPDEPLSPELVLVLPAEQRAQVLAGLPLPARPQPKPILRPASPPAVGPRTVEAPVGEPIVRSVGKLVAARFAQLALIFVAVTILTLALSLVAQAFR